MFSRPNSTWTTAFTTATKVEAEGAKFFEGFLPTKKTTLSSFSAVETSTNGSDLDVDEEDVGGFCQPQHLALFVQRVNSSNPHNRSAEPADDTIDTEQGRATDAEKNNMGRQICRAWLKHHFLSLGKPCAQTNCERKHDVNGMNVGQLYKDFSFKGLATAQRNTIIKSVQASQVEDINSGIINSSSSGSSSSSSATGLKRKQGDDNVVIETFPQKLARIDDVPPARTASQSMNTMVVDGSSKVVIEATTTTMQGKHDRTISAQVTVDPLYPRYTIEGERKKRNLLWYPWHRCRW